MKNIYFFIFLIFLSCSTGNKVYICGNHECKNQKEIDDYFKIAKKYNLSLTQMSLAFINSQPFVTSNIIGATTLDQLKEDIGSIDIKLDKEVVDEINLVHRNNPNPAP